MMRSIVILFILIITTEAAYTGGSEVTKPSEEDIAVPVDHERTLKKKSKGRSRKEDDSENEEEPVKKGKGHRSSGGGDDNGEDDSEETETDSTTANKSGVVIPQTMVPTPTTIFVFPTFNPVSSSTNEPTNPPYTKPPYSKPEENEDVPASVETMVPTSDSLAAFAFPTLNPMTTVTSEPTRPPLTSGPTHSPATNEPTKGPTSSPVTYEPTTKKPTVNPITTVPTRSPSQSPITDNPTDAPTSKPVTSTDAPTSLSKALQTCPPAYDHTKTTYIAGDLILVNGHIFQCREEDGYEMYCNLSIRPENENDGKMWHDAWVHVRPCPLEGETNGSIQVTSTTLPSKAPVVSPVTSSPTMSVEKRTITTTDNLPICPSHYSTTETYIVGDIIESNMHLWRCRNQKYCNIVDIVDGWNNIQVQEWRAAWLLIGPCEKEEVEPITRTAATSSAQVTPLCPDAYDPNKTDYVAEDIITVKCHVFKCRQHHEIYCNTASWDDSLLYQDVRAKEMWRNAWEMLGSCLPAQDDLNLGKC